MNKTDIVEIMSMKTTKLAVLSAAFALMMVFLVPVLTEEAQANVNAESSLPPGLRFSSLSVGLQVDEGRSRGPPVNYGQYIAWGTIPSVPSGPEKATLSAWVDNFGRIYFSFNKPTSGEPTCEVKFSDSSRLRGSCNFLQIESGPTFVNFEVQFKRQQNTDYLCDFLAKFGGLEQTKIFSKKLPLLKCK